MASSNKRKGNKRSKLTGININLTDFLIEEKPLLKATTPLYISMSNLPPALGGIVHDLSIQECASIFGFTLKEGIEGFNTRNMKINESIVSDISRDDLMAQVTKVLNNPHPGLIISKINEKVGYGVFAKEAIKKNSVLCMYSGCINHNKSQKGGYSFQYYQQDLYINPTKYRGIASFFQHLPSKLKIDIYMKQAILHSTGQFITKEEIMQNDELYSIQFKSENMLDNLATANLNAEYMVYEGIPIIVFITNQDIEPGEQLGFNYGYKYWQANNIQPEYFDKQGGIIPHSEYKRIFGTIKINKFTYTGYFQSLIESLSTKNPLFLQINHEVVAKIDLRNALIYAKALDISEGKQDSFKITAPIALEKVQQKRDDYLKLLEETAIVFNHSHCINQEMNKGYWTAKEYLEKDSSATHYKTGILNSPFFIKKGAFCFAMIEGKSAYEACSSFVGDSAFGVINDFLWINICQLLAFQKVLNKEVFDYIFSDLILSGNLYQTKLNLMNFSNHRGNNIGSVETYNNDPDYKFRHPFSSYKSISTLNLSEKKIAMGFEKSLTEDEMVTFLKEKYYCPQTENELDYIQKVSANRLLDYLVPENKFKISQHFELLLNLPWLALLQLSDNNYDILAWIKTFKDSFHYLTELDVFYDNYRHEKQFTIDAFTPNLWWRIVFTDNKFDEKNSFEFPLKEDYFFLFSSGIDSRHTSTKYSYVDRRQIKYSESLLTVCSSIIMYYLNANFFKMELSFIDAFKLIQQLRFQLLELKSENQLKNVLFLPVQNKPEVEKQIKPEVLEKITALVAVDPQVKQLITQKKKDECKKERDKLCYQMTLPITATEKDIELKRRDLLFFWHPDKNKSIIAEKMTKQIINEADEAIKLTRELELLEFECSKENRLLK